MLSDTIALIDDDAAVLDSLRMVLAKRSISAECFSSAEDFLAAVERLSPACIVSDVRMPGLSGLDLQNELRARASEAPLILITGHGDIAMAVRAIKAGAFDFIEKPFDHDVLIEAIHRAIESGARARMQHGKIAEIAARAGELSLRQRQVLGFVAQGLSNKEIALRLGLSPRTVENYRAWVMEKMGARNLADLVRMVVLLETSDAPGAAKQT
jgi:two-component system, LuxR family, response regulator FixJ